MLVTTAVLSTALLPDVTTRTISPSEALEALRSLAETHPPSLPPLSLPPPAASLPLEVGDPHCIDLALGPQLGSSRHTQRATYTIFGGSNSHGANAKALAPNGGTIYGPGIPSFAHLLAARLNRSHDVRWLSLIHI